MSALKRIFLVVNSLLYFEFLRQGLFYLRLVWNSTMLVAEDYDLELPSSCLSNCVGCAYFHAWCWWYSAELMALCTLCGYLPAKLHPQPDLHGKDMSHHHYCIQKRLLYLNVKPNTVFTKSPCQNSKNKSRFL